jgi:general stress protein 26
MRAYYEYMGNISHVQEIVAYIKLHPVMVVSTADERGRPHGAAVYVYTDSLEWVYFITKTDTQKFQNLRENPHVSLTALDESNNSTLQITGRAEAVHNAETIEMVMGNMTKIYAHSHDWLPPIAKFRAGPYQVVGVKLDHARLAQYKKAQPGDPNIFKEVTADDL